MRSVLLRSHSASFTAEALLIREIFIRISKRIWDREMLHTLDCYADRMNRQDDSEGRSHLVSFPQEEEHQVAFPMYEG